MRAGDGSGDLLAVPRATGKRPARADGGNELDARGKALFEALRAFRIETARREGVPPYVIASDRTLRDLALLRPANRSELLLVHGIGPAKAERYGEALLRVVKTAGA